MSFTGIRYDGSGPRGVGQPMLLPSVDVDIAGAAGDTTLTADQYGYPVLNLTGVKTGNRTVTVPTVEDAVYLVVNNSTGAFTTTIKTAAGTGVDVANAKSAWVRCDGVNIVRVTADA
mgnify:FL=1